MALALVDIENSALASVAGEKNPGDRAIPDLLRQFPTGLLRRQELGVPLRPVCISHASAPFVFAVCGFGPPERGREIGDRRERSFIPIDAAGEPGRHFLHQPLVAVRIAERGI
jgi:hypothetical protein